MSKLTKEQKNYITSFKSWYNIQRLGISSLESNLDNSQKMVSIHKSLVSLFSSQLQHEIKLTESEVNVFKEWTKQNNIDLDKVGKFLLDKEKCDIIVDGPIIQSAVDRAMKVKRKK